MARFITETTLTILRGQFRQGRQLYRLHSTVVYESDLLNTRIYVPAGYITDLASVPKLPLLWLMAGGSGAEAAVIHDYLYSTHAVAGRPVTRSEADAVFREAIAASEDVNAPGSLMWLAVRVGGWRAWDAPGPDQPAIVQAAMEIEAP